MAMVKRKPRKKGEGHWITTDDDQHIYISGKGEFLPRGPGSKPRSKGGAHHQTAEGKARTAELVAKARAGRKPTHAEIMDPNSAYNNRQFSEGLAKARAATMAKRAATVAVVKERQKEMGGTYKEAKAGFYRKPSVIAAERTASKPSPPKPGLKEQAAKAPVKYGKPLTLTGETKAKAVGKVEALLKKKVWTEHDAGEAMHYTKGGILPESKRVPLEKAVQDYLGVRRFQAEEAHRQKIAPFMKRAGGSPEAAAERLKGVQRHQAYRRARAEGKIDYNRRLAPEDYQRIGSVRAKAAANVKANAPAAREKARVMTAAELRQGRKEKGVPVRDWTGAPTGERTPFAAAVHMAKVERGARRQERAEAKAPQKPAVSLSQAMNASAVAKLQARRAAKLADPTRRSDLNERIKDRLADRTYAAAKKQKVEAVRQSDVRGSEYRKLKAEIVKKARASLQRATPQAAQRVAAQRQRAAKRLPGRFPLFLKNPAVKSMAGF